MKYAIAVERGDADHAFGVIVPDLPGSFSAVDTFEQAIDNGREAIELHVEGLLDAGEQLPRPRPLDELVGDRALRGMCGRLSTFRLKHSTNGRAHQLIGAACCGGSTHRPTAWAARARASWPNRR
jgi:predicted RNase H-like HicB family nuclease